MTTTTQHATRLTDLWLRMWNEDPSLAHEAVADPVSIWFATTDAGGRVGDAADLEAFVAAYRKVTPNEFTPRVLAADPVTNRFAYSWDVDLARGGTLSGLDLNTLDDDGRIVVNWSATGAVLRPHDVVTPSGSPLDRVGLERVVRAWTAGHEGVAHPGLGTRVIGDLVIDEAAQRVAFTYAVPGAGAVDLGGIALLAIGDGGVRQAWSVTGQRPLEFV